MQLLSPLKISFISILSKLSETTVVVVTVSGHLFTTYLALHRPLSSPPGTSHTLSDPPFTSSLLHPGQAMEIGSAALNILVECWDGHLTPPEVASLADRASRARDPNMVRAAAELALSCLPHAHALNPNEIQRALVQCKEQVSVM